LVVEVISPANKANEVETKVQEYLRLGVRMVWLVYPQLQSVTVERAGAPAVRVRAGEMISSEDVLPGFEAPVAAFFGPPAAAAASQGIPSAEA
jgi:Uma2 family endonuclease